MSSFCLGSLSLEKRSDFLSNLFALINVGHGDMQLKINMEEQNLVQFLENCCYGCRIGLGAFRATSSAFDSFLSTSIVDDSGFCTFLVPSLPAGRIALPIKQYIRFDNVVKAVDVTAAYCYRSGTHSVAGDLIRWCDSLGRLSYDDISRSFANVKFSTIQNALLGSHVSSIWSDALCESDTVDFKNPTDLSSLGRTQRSLYSMLNTSPSVYLILGVTDDKLVVGCTDSLIKEYINGLLSVMWPLPEKVVVTLAPVLLDVDAWNKERLYEYRHPTSVHDAALIQHCIRSSAGRCSWDVDVSNVGGDACLVIFAELHDFPKGFDGMFTKIESVPTSVALPPRFVARVQFDAAVAVTGCYNLHATAWDRATRLAVWLRLHSYHPDFAASTPLLGLLSGSTVARVLIYYVDAEKKDDDTAALNSALLSVGAYTLGLGSFDLKISARDFSSVTSKQDIEELVYLFGGRAVVAIDARCAQSFWQTKFFFENDVHFLILVPSWSSAFPEPVFPHSPDARVMDYCALGMNGRAFGSYLQRRFSPGLLMGNNADMNISDVLAYFDVVNELRDTDSSTDMAEFKDWFSGYRRAPPAWSFCFSHSRKLYVTKATKLVCRDIRIRMDMAEACIYRPMYFHKVEPGCGATSMLCLVATELCSDQMVLVLFAKQGITMNSTKWKTLSPSLWNTMTALKCFHLVLIFDDAQPETCAWLEDFEMPIQFFVVCVAVAPRRWVSSRPISPYLDVDDIPSVVSTLLRAFPQSAKALERASEMSSVYSSEPIYRHMRLFTLSAFSGVYVDATKWVQDYCTGRKQEAVNAATLLCILGAFLERPACELSVFDLAYFLTRNLLNVKLGDFLFPVSLLSLTKGANNFFVPQVFARYGLRHFFDIAVNGADEYYNWERKEEFDKVIRMLEWVSKEIECPDSIFRWLLIDRGSNMKSRPVFTELVRSSIECYPSSESSIPHLVDRCYRLLGLNFEKPFVPRLHANLLISRVFRWFARRDDTTEDCKWKFLLEAEKYNNEALKQAQSSPIVAAIEHLARVKYDKFKYAKRNGRQSRREIGNTVIRGKKINELRNDAIQALRDALGMLNEDNEDSSYEDLVKKLKYIEKK